MLKLIIFTLLIGGTRDLSPSLFKQHNDEEITQAITEVAINLDLEYKTDASYYLTPDVKYKITARRYEQTKDCPHSWEIHRFDWFDKPNLQTGVNNQFRYNLSLYYQSQKDLQKHRQDYWDKMIEDVKSCQDIEDNLRNARRSTCVYCRTYLKNLRSSIGSEAFYNGQLPPLAPIYNMPLIDR